MVSTPDSNTEHRNQYTQTINRKSPPRYASGVQFPECWLSASSPRPSSTAGRSAQHRAEFQRRRRRPAMAAHRLRAYVRCGYERDDRPELALVIIPMAMLCRRSFRAAGRGASSGGAGRGWRWPRQRGLLDHRSRANFRVADRSSRMRLTASGGWTDRGRLRALSVPISPPPASGQTQSTSPSFSRIWQCEMVRPVMPSAGGRDSNCREASGQATRDAPEVRAQRPRRPISEAWHNSGIPRPIVRRADGSDNH